MANVPIHIQAASGKPYGRQAMWNAMRDLRVFTAKDIAHASNRKTDTVREYFKRLVSAGIIKAGDKLVTGTIGNLFRAQLYILVQDMGHEAPRLNPDGSPLVEARDHMWRTMKMLQSFTYFDLATAASTEECPVNPRDAQDYCGDLLRAGYLVCLRDATPSNKALYRLLPSMNTGPHAPKVQRTKCVFDPNLNKIMWHEDIEP
ncbi:MAG: hypothetical protein RRY29_03695 [Desulfovibrionaceae bacterium]